MNVTTAQIREIVGSGGKASLIKGFVKALNERGAEFGINNYNRLCHFVAQCCHESAHFRTFEEYASGAAYEGRRDLGNIFPGDGKRYKGRGPIQLTGRANYEIFGPVIGYDIKNEPTLASDPEIGTLLSMAFWQKNGLNRLADADNVKAVTKRVNGGYNGLQDRINYLKKAKAALKNVDFSNNGSENETDFPLQRGSRGKKVRELQEIMVGLGYDVSVDGAFGPNTEREVKQLQEDLDMDKTGVVDETMWEILTIDEEE